MAPEERPTSNVFFYCDNLPVYCDNLPGTYEECAHAASSSRSRRSSRAGAGGRCSRIRRATAPRSGRVSRHESDRPCDSSMQGSLPTCTLVATDRLVEGLRL
jgi:hypothetical protein